MRNARPGDAKCITDFAATAIEVKAPRRALKYRGSWHSAALHPPAQRCYVTGDVAARSHAVRGSLSSIALAGQAKFAARG
jgi:hypothetical protein